MELLHALAPLVVLASAVTATPPPIAHVGTTLAEPAPASVFSPGRFHAVVRIPSVRDRLFIVGQWSMQELHVTIVRNSGRTELTGAQLPGARFGVELPDDVAAARAVEIDGTVVNAGGAPRLRAGTALYARAAESWPAIALFGMLAGVAAIVAVLAVGTRSRTAAWFAALLAAEATGSLPLLGAVRPPALVNQPLHGIVVTLIIIASLGFARAYFGRALVSGWWLVAAVATSAVTAAYFIGGDLWQDTFVFGLSPWYESLLDFSSLAVFAAIGVRAMMTGRREAIWYVAAQVFSALGFVAQAAALPIPGDALSNAAEVIALTIGFAFTLRRREKERIGLEVAVRVDALTGLANRRSFDATLLSEWSRAERAQTQLAAIMIDVDDFKRYNDRFGHPRGDDVLRLVATTIATVVQRREDCAARYGGEEFVALLPGAELDGAVAIAEHIRIAVEALAIPAAGDTGYVTVSLGVAVLVPDLALSPEDLIVLADAALYAAKRNGRNRVEVGELPPRRGALVS